MSILFAGMLLVIAVIFILFIAIMGLMGALFVLDRIKEKKAVAPALPPPGSAQG